MYQTVIVQIVFLGLILLVFFIFVFLYRFIKGGGGRDTITNGGLNMSAKSMSFIIVIMVWITILTYWAVNQFLPNIDHNVHVSGIQIPSSQDANRYFAVQVGSEVWIIDDKSSVLQIISHDENGYHQRQVKMDFTSVK